MQEFYDVKNHLDKIHFDGFGIQYDKYENFGFILLRNCQYIVGDISKAYHAENEDLLLTPGRFLKLNELQIKTILDTENFKDE